MIHMQVANGGTVKILGNNKVLIGDTNNVPPPSSPTYTLTRSASAFNEGSSITFTLSATNVDNGTLVPYTITGISAVDLMSNLLSGNFVINNGSDSVTLTAVADSLTEGSETITFGTAGQSLSALINDTSLAPTYSLSRSASLINEGGSVTYTLRTTNVANGTTIPYTITGISSADLSSGSLTGNFIINSNISSITLTVANDNITEGTETISIAAASRTTTTSINDTSTTPVAQVSTLAGSTAGFADNQGTLAKFYNPLGLTTDPSGNIYVADSANHKIRKISPTGLVTTFAGGVLGFANLQGTSAKFSSPTDVFYFDGNLYVVDMGNACIRKIDMSANVTTFAANPVNGSAYFHTPSCLTVDQNGNVYVADTTTNQIRKITPQGNVSTFAGSGANATSPGQGTAASFSFTNGKTGLTTDSSNNVYVSSNTYVCKITPSGYVSLWSTGVTGNIFNWGRPAGLATAADGSIYAVDRSNHRIVKITPNLTLSTVAGSNSGGSASYGYLDGAATAAKFNNPESITIDSSGNIYVSDTLNHRIRKIVL